MKRYFTLASMALFCISIYFYIQFNRLNDGEVLTAEVGEYTSGYLGNLSFGHRRLLHFIVHNNGKNSEKIIGAFVSCGCTVISPEVRLIPAGGTARVNVAVNGASLGYRKITVCLGFENSPPTTIDFAVKVVAD